MHFSCILGYIIKPLRPESMKYDCVFCLQASMTMEQAEQICFDFINSLPAVRDFSDRLKGIDKDKMVRECAFDVFVSTTSDVFIRFILYFDSSVNNVLS